MDIKLAAGCFVMRHKLMKHLVRKSTGILFLSHDELRNYMGSSFIYAIDQPKFSPHFSYKPDI